MAPRSSGLPAGSAYAAGDFESERSARPDKRRHTSNGKSRLSGSPGRKSKRGGSRGVGGGNAGGLRQKPLRWPAESASFAGALRRLGSGSAFATYVPAPGLVTK